MNEEEEGMVVIGGGAAGHTAVETLRSAQVLSHIVHIGNDNDNDIVHHQVIICTLVMMSSSPTATSASNFTSNFEAKRQHHCPIFPIFFYASIFPSQEKKKVLFQNFEEFFFFRKEGFRGPITLVCKEPHLPYDRPKLSKSLGVSQSF